MNHYFRIVLFFLTLFACSTSFEKRINVDEASDLIKNTSKNLVILDVRTINEFKKNHIEGAINIDYFSSDFSTDLSKLKRNITYIVYCRSGSRSAKTISTMKKLGFKKLYEIDGGITDWLNRQKPVSNKL